MKIVEPSFSFNVEYYPAEMILRIERAGRVCYQSEPQGDPEAFVRTLIRKGHYSVLEHESISVRLIVDRGVSHELVRHRLASFSQESTRYCDYGKDDIEFIKPVNIHDDDKWRELWTIAMMKSEAIYKEMRKIGVPPQVARSVLPNSLKTEVVMTANIREWRHVLVLRSSPAAHPDMRHIMRLLLKEFKSIWPALFEDIRCADDQA